VPVGNVEVIGLPPNTPDQAISQRIIPVNMSGLPTRIVQGPVVGSLLAKEIFTDYLTGGNETVDVGVGGDNMSMYYYYSGGDNGDYTIYDYYDDLESNGYVDGNEGNVELWTGPDGNIMPVMSEFTTYKRILKTAFLSNFQSLLLSIIAVPSNGNDNRNNTSGD
jgi:hypothetical protein